MAVRQAALVSDESALEARDYALYKLTTFTFLPFLPLLTLLWHSLQVRPGQGSHMLQAKAMVLKSTPKLVARTQHLWRKPGG